MNLLEITKQLHQENELSTILAKEPWNENSEIHIVKISEDSPNELDINGYKYFLEIFVAKEIVPDLSKSKDIGVLKEWCGKLIHFAINDA